MTKRSHIALAILILSLPSLLFLWWNRDDPHFGILQDDGLYFIAGKALAQGSAYRIESLPAQPYQTKYPPLYPLLLSLAWRIDPSFPSNLAAALLLSWLCLPAVALLFYLWCRRNGLETRAAWLVVALFALNPYVLFFVSNLGSELLFTAFALASILLAENREKDWRSVLVAGALAGAAYLTRTAGIALLPAAIVYFLWHRQPRKALWFTAGMIPAIAGWTLWSRSHTPGGHDIVTLYYTNYLAYQFANVTRDNILVVLWKNFSGLLEALGSFLFPQMLQGLPGKIILQPLAIAMILGCVRMARRRVSLYLIFAAISAGVLLVWHGVPNQRLVMPLVPLFLAGFWTEAVHFSGLVRKALAHPDRSQRVGAYGFAGFLIAILATGLGLNIYMWAGILPEMARSDRQNARSYDAVYSRRRQRPMGGRYRSLSRHRPPRRVPDHLRPQLV